MRSAKSFAAAATLASAILCAVAGRTAPLELPAKPYEKIIAAMGDHPAVAGRALSHPATDLQRLDYALYLHAFRPRSRARDDAIRALLAPVERDIAKNQQWGLDQIGPRPRYDGSDKSLIATIQAASLSATAISQSAYYAIPCAVLQRRPGLLAATQPQFGSNGDNFIPRSGCGERGAVRGFPAKLEAAYDDATSTADGFGEVMPQGTIWYGIWAGQNATRAAMMVDPRLFLKQRHPALAFPYQAWSYLTLSNRDVAANIRKKYVVLHGALARFYRGHGLSAAEARRAARNALFAVTLGADCGKAPPRRSLRTLLLDGAPAWKIEAFIRSGAWKDPTRLAALNACAVYADRDPLIDIALTRPALLPRLRKLASSLTPDQRKALDLELDPNAANTIGKTPLMTAAQHDLVAGARWLLREHADIAARTDDALVFDHRTALHYAAASGSLAMIRLLLAHGADRAAADVRGDTFRGTLLNGKESQGGLRPIDYLDGKGPTAANPRLSPAQRAEARRLLAP